MNDCEYCSGSGCVYCRQLPENVEAPEIVEGRRGFTPQEVVEFRFPDKEAAEIMVNYLNRRCSCEIFCPETINICRTDCRCFKKAYKYSYDGGYRIGGFDCNNTKLTMDSNEWHTIIENLRRQI